MQFRQLDHVALHVSDVATSRNFYETVLQLDALTRPAFDFPGAWFRLASSQELHLIGDRDETVHSHRRGNHFALQVDDIDAWEQHLQQAHQSYVRRLRPDGAHQIFIHDPDGHCIELCSIAP